MRSMYQYLDVKKHEDLALWCSYLLSFYCLFRKKNVFSESSEPNCEKTLRRKHIRVDVDENIVYIYCNFSKTDQFGDHDLVIRIPANTNPCMDLVRYIDQLSQESELSRTLQPLFLLLQDLFTSAYSQQD